MTTGTNALDGNNGYQYGLVINSNSAGPVSIDHLDAWGGGQDGVEFRAASTAQISLTNSWIHDLENSAPNGFHSDGVGFMQGTAGPSNILIQGNTIASLGNSDGVAFQAATSGYSNLQIIGNYLSGYGYTADLCSPGSVPCTNSSFKSNVFGTDIEPVFGPNYGAWTQATNVWKCNTISVRSGTTWNPSNNVSTWGLASNGISWAPSAGQDNCYWLPTTGADPSSSTDYLGNATCP